MKPTANSRGGVYAPTEEVELKAKLSTLNRRMKELEQRNHQEVRAVAEATMPSQPCFNCQSTRHQGEHCLISPSVRDLMVESASVMGKNRPPNDAQYGNTYNPNWKNHPNLAWKPKPPVYAPPPPPPPPPQEHLSSNSTDPVLNSSSHQLLHLWSKLS